MSASNQISPSDDDLRAAVIKLKTANPSMGIGKLRSSVLQENPAWQLSENRVKRLLQAEGLINSQPAPASGKQIFPASRVIKDLDIERWTGRVEVRYFDKKRGKGLVAKEKIAAGEIIWKEDPFIIAPEWDIFDLQQNSRACMHCTTPLGDSSLIARCSASTSSSFCPARFCNRLCHSRAQRTHPLVCAAQNPASVPIIAFARKNTWLGLHALVQCTARLLLDVQGDDPKPFEDDWKVVSALAMLGMEERVKGDWVGGMEPSHAVWRKAFDLYVQAFDAPATPAEQKKLARVLKHTLPDDVRSTMFTYDGFLQGLGRMSLNLEGHGGLYTLHSHINHDCEPNVSVRHLDQRSALSRISIIAKRDLEPGEEILATYVDPNLSLKMRRNFLGSWNFGVCKCKRCVEEEKAGVSDEQPAESKPNAQDMNDLENELKAGLGVM